MIAPRIYDEAAIRSGVPLDINVVQAIEGAFRKLASGLAIMPPVHQLLVDDRHGQTCVKSGYFVGDPWFVIKAASTFHDNALAGLPNTSGLMLVISAETGFLDTILLDNGYLTATRTAAAGAVAANLLARRDARSVTVVGTGKQARLQLDALRLVRPIDEVTIAGRDRDKAERLARIIETEAGLTARSAPITAEAFRSADIVVTTTPARSPVIERSWIAPGTHVTAMGSDAPGKCELPPALVASAALYAADSSSQCASLGEWAAALASGAIVEGSRPAELGDLITGTIDYVRAPDDITIADLTGLGVQDAEIALLARDRCGAGASSGPV